MDVRIDVLLIDKKLHVNNYQKLADCSEKDPEKCEIYFVEGDSAAGSAKQGRDRRTQAILPVFGKIQNVDKARFTDVIKSVKMADIVKALKCGIAEDFDISKLRYHKIILMSDADVDGDHIKCLNVTFFFRFMRPIIDAGMLYMACPPLFKLQKGKTIRYAYSDAERDSILAEMGEGTSIQRYKGLGEMNAEQLWETTMNPETRTLIQITAEDAEAADAMVTLCMGEKVEPRREFIQENALYAVLDV